MVVVAGVVAVKVMIAVAAAVVVDASRETLWRPGDAKIYC